MFASKTTLAFTLIEVLVVIGLISIAAGIGLLFSLDSYRSSSFYTERNSLVSLLQHARAQAQHQVCEGGSCKTGVSHGVSIQLQGYVVFQGPDYATREREYDAFIERDSPITIHGLKDVVFESESGNVITTGAIVLIDSAKHRSEISIGSQGQISWTH